MKGSFRRAAGALLLILGSACGSDPVDQNPATSAPGSCPQDLPTACPTPPPSYRQEVTPLLTKHCVSCHQPGGNAANKPFGSYAEVYALRSAVLNQVYACRMPPPDAAALTATERSLLLTWLVCRAPDN